MVNITLSPSLANTPLCCILKVFVHSNSYIVCNDSTFNRRESFRVPSAFSYNLYSHLEFFYTKKKSSKITVCTINMQDLQNIAIPDYFRSCPKTPIKCSAQINHEILNL